MGNMMMMARKEEHPMFEVRSAHKQSSCNTTQATLQHRLTPIPKFIIMHAHGPNMHHVAGA
jgi:hypothetical protein